MPALDWPQFFILIFAFNYNQSEGCTCMNMYQSEERVTTGSEASDQDSTLK